MESVNAGVAFSKLVPLPPPANSRIQNKELGLGKELIVDIPIDDKGTHGNYVDDIIGLTLDMPGSNNLERCAGAHLLAIAVTARRSHCNEPKPREAMEAINKLVAEATPEVTKMILGWLMIFDKMIVPLPDNKYLAWSQTIQERVGDFDRTIGTFGRNHPVCVPFSRQA